MELDDKYRVYSVKDVPEKMICLRVPLRCWTRLRSARMSRKIIQGALEVRERHTIEKHRFPNELIGNEQANILNRITKIEDTLKVIELSLKQLTDKLIEK